MKQTLAVYLDENGVIKIWPSKKGRKIEVLLYLGGKFDYGVVYTEKQVNAIIQSWHTFGDFFLLRRELIINGILMRTRDGSQYWKSETGPCKLSGAD